MSCQLGLLANILDASGVKRYVVPHLKDDVRSNDTTEGWDDSDWGWKDEDEYEGGGEDDASVGVSLQSSWLQQCQVSISPAADLMAIANDDRLALLAQKWSSQADEDVQMKFNVVFQGCIKQEEGDKITAVMCLPLASQKRSTQGGPDWTGVMVGFSSGYVRVYTETGTLLLSQIFSDEPVEKIKCRTYQPPRHSADAEKHEELTILYRKSLVIIDGFSLVQSLRACRNQVARAAASGSELIQPPPLAYKKWGLHDQDHVADHASAGLTTPNPFDQMMTGSMIGGYTASIRSTPPASHLYVTSGRAPYIGFFYAVEGSTQPMLSDVAHAVASKLKSALFSQISAASGWLGLGNKHNVENHREKKPKIEPATSLPSRFGIHDKRREGESVVLSPDNRLAAVTDSFGRVMLVDVVQGTAVRMWKGYRDAQVGWLDVGEDPPQDRSAAPHPPRRALFLVIYAARRGILEVWAAQQGPRVAAFNVSKWCVMLCPSHGMMGLNNVSYRSVRVHLYSIYLVDPEGTIKILDVPFHLALGDKNSKRARDMHLLKKLKIVLKEHHAESGALQGEVVQTLLDIKISGIRQQGLERVLQTKYLTPGFLLSVTAAVAKQLESLAPDVDLEGSAVSAPLDYESRLLAQYCRVQGLLLHTYQAVSRVNAAEHSHTSDPVTEETLGQTLSVASGEAGQLLRELEAYWQTVEEPSGARHVTFQADPAVITVTDFLGCFECQMTRAEPSGGATGTSGASGGGTSGGAGAADSADGSFLRVHVSPGLSESRTLRLARFLFAKTLEHGTSSDFNHLLKESHIPAENLLSLLLLLWLGDERRVAEDTVPLKTLVKSITSLKDASDVMIPDDNSPSPWWQTLREYCSQSQNIVSALLAAYVCRSVAMELAIVTTEAQMTGSAHSDKVDLSDYESVTIDRARWTVLVKQLEDLLAVQCLLKMKPANEGLAPKTTWEPEPIRVSVKRVLDGGRGVLPEFVAKWIAGQGISPEMLCLTEEPIGAEKHEEEPMETRQGEKATNEKLQRVASVFSPIIGQLWEVQKRLPHSLDADILMTNCAWEYMVLWNKDPEGIFAMEQALEYLKCIQNGVLQHGLSAMMWQMFIVKKLSATAMLMEKVGKAPKDRLCRRDVGLSEVSMERFLKIVVDLLETILQARADMKETPVFNVEDLWQNVQGPTSLVELALEQKETNLDLLKHHRALGAIMHATMAFSMRSVRPISLFNSKGRNAFFKPLQSTTPVPSRVLDEELLSNRRQFMCRVLTNAIETLADKPLPLAGRGSPASTDPSTPASPAPPSSPGAPHSPSPSSSPPAPGLESLGSLSLWRGAQSYSRWPPLLLSIAQDMCLEQDDIRRHHVVELYSHGLDKMAEEVLLTVSDHVVLGSQLLLLAGRRLNHFILVVDPQGSVDKLSKCSPTVSSWIRTLDPSELTRPQVPLADTAGLVGQAANQLPEGHSEYKMAIELVELIHTLS